MITACVLERARGCVRIFFALRTALEWDMIVGVGGACL